MDEDKLESQGYYTDRENAKQAKKRTKIKGIRHCF